jgi:putative transposase
MPKRIVTLLSNNIYHIYNRGVNKELTFFSEKNYQYFLYKMAWFFRENASIYAHCLMSNHFHLLVKVNSDDFTIKSLQPFLLSYSKAINNEQDRVGPLFQGRYQANLIEDEVYLLDCVKYIHLNPVKSGLVRTPGQWKYSSYASYLNPGKQDFVDTTEVMRYFNNVNDFQEFSEFGMEDYESKYFTEA